MVSVALQKAQAHLQTWTKGAETQKATTAKTNINSVFDAAQKAINDARKNGESASIADQNSAAATIKEAQANAEALGSENSQKVTQILQDLNAVSQFEQQIQQKQQEKQQKIDEIKSLGGEIEAQDVTETEEAETSPAEDGASNTEQTTTKDDKSNTKAESKTTKKSTHIKKSTKKPSAENQAKIEQLKQEVGTIDGEIKNIQTQKETPQKEISQLTEEFTANVTTIKDEQSKATSAKADAEQKLPTYQKEAQTEVKKQTTALNKEIKNESKAAKTNTKDAAKAVTLKTKLEAEEAAAQAAKSSPIGGIVSAADTDSAARKQAIIDLGNMDTDLNMTSGAAKDNTANVNTGNTNSQQINQAMTKLTSQDFPGFTNSLNEIYTTAMQSFNTQLSIQLPNQDKNSAKAEKSDNGNKALASAGGNILQGFAGKIAGGGTGSEIGDMAVGMAVDVAKNLITGFFG